MNPNYTEFKFPQIKSHPWAKVSTFTIIKSHFYHKKHFCLNRNPCYFYLRLLISITQIILIHLILRSNVSLYSYFCFKFLHISYLSNHQYTFLCLFFYFNMLLHLTTCQLFFTFFLSGSEQTTLLLNLKYYVLYFKGNTFLQYTNHVIYFGLIENASIYFCLNFKFACLWRDFFIYMNHFYSTIYPLVI